MKRFAVLLCSAAIAQATVIIGPDSLQLTRSEALVDANLEEIVSEIGSFYAVRDSDTTDTTVRFQITGGTGTGYLDLLLTTHAQLVTFPEENGIFVSRSAMVLTGGTEPIARATVSFLRFQGTQTDVCETAPGGFLNCGLIPFTFGESFDLRFVANSASSFFFRRALRDERVEPAMAGFRIISGADVEVRNAWVQDASGQFSVLENATIRVEAVPEPATFALLGGALLALGIRAQRLLPSRRQ